ncbi:MAG: hypothetical protein ACK4OO_03470, partial [bacterium]
ASAAGVFFIALTLLSGDIKGFSYSYLVAFIFWYTLSWGALVFLLIHHLTGSVWSIVIRRLWENIAGTIPIWALFFIPILILNSFIYPWTDPDVVSHSPLLVKKSSYLNMPFFAIRGIIYWIILIFITIRMRKLPLTQDLTPHSVGRRDFVKIAAPGTILYAVVVTFAAFDWVMSVEPEWYSTIYGVYLAMGGCVASLAAMIGVIEFLRKRKVFHGILGEAESIHQPITVEHYHDLGKLLFTFIILWAYMVFSQYFLIWYANIPEETAFYRHRWVGSWRWVSLMIVFGHFVLPFFVLISQPAKRNRVVLLSVSLGILFFHYVDLYWNVLPVLDKEGLKFRWSDLGTMLLLGGMFCLRQSRFVARSPLIPIGDPQLLASVKHRQH